MWTMALRAFDDVKESVRSAAAGLLRSLRGISLRLMDRQQTPAAGTESTANTIHPVTLPTVPLSKG
jgi:proteasome component ECM29